MRTASRLLAVPLALLALQLSACTEDPGGDASGEPSQEADESPRGADEPAPEDTPDVPMADGPEVDRPAFSFNLPDRWRIDKTRPTFSDNSVNAIGPTSLDGVLSLTLGTSEDTPYDSIEEMADDYLESVRDQGSDKVRRVDDLEIDGETALHATGPGSRGTEKFHAVLVLHDGLVVDMIVRTPGTPEESLELVESMLATWQWK